MLKIIKHILASTNTLSQNKQQALSIQKLPQYFMHEMMKNVGGSHLHLKHINFIDGCVVRPKKNVCLLQHNQP